jgi:glycine/D-amino acid oxidase-like deaminating enzyme
VSQRFEAIVVGGGVIGAAVMHRLAARFDGRVLLVEQGRFGGGATGWSGGIVRCYHDDDVLADMACEGDAFYRAFERHTGAPLSITRTGFVHAVHPSGAEAAQRTVARLTDRIAIAWLPQHAARGRFPDMRWDDLAGAVFEPDAGHMDSCAVTTAFVVSARASGAVAMEGVRFQGLLAEGGSTAGVLTSLGPFYAPRVVMCTGAWTGRTAARARLDLPEPVHAKAIQLNTFHTNGASATGAGGARRLAFLDPGAGLYGRAEGEHLFHLGVPVPEWDIDPDAPADVSAAHVALSQREGTHRFPWLADALPAGGFRRFDGYTAGGRGVMAAAHQPGLYWAAGFSGGGFKLAPAIAARIAELVASCPRRRVPPHKDNLKDFHAHYPHFRTHHRHRLRPAMPGRGRAPFRRQAAVRDHALRRQTRRHVDHPQPSRI